MRSITAQSAARVIQRAMLKLRVGRHQRSFVMVCCVCGVRFVFKVLKTCSAGSSPFIPPSQRSEDNDPVILLLGSGTSSSFSLCDNCESKHPDLAMGYHRIRDRFMCSSSMFCFLGRRDGLVLSQFQEAVAQNDAIGGGVSDGHEDELGYTTEGIKR